MKNSIRVVAASPEDAMSIEEVRYAAWLKTYPNAQAGVTIDDVHDRFKERFSSDSLAKKAARLANPPPGEYHFVAKEGGNIVGFCLVIQHADKNQLQAIYVSPAHQGRGVGTLLWKAARACLDTKKSTVVYLATYNEKALNFYRRFGFKDTGKRLKNEKLRMKSGAVIPEMEMLRKAASAS